MDSRATYEEKETSYVIVGAGCFGAATALALASHRGVKVTLVDPASYPNPRAASHDFNKIVRDDYPDELYMRILTDAMQQWRHNDLYREYYHEVGMLRADESAFGMDSIAAYQKLGVQNSSVFLPVDQVRRDWNGIFSTADFGSLSHVLYNPAVGFAEADKALAAVVQKAILLGVQYKIGELSVLSLDGEGQCAGIQLTSGERINGDRVLLATGAHTPAILAQTSPDNPQIHAGDRLLAAGALSFYAKLRGAQQQKFEGIPIMKNSLSTVKGEGISMLSDGTLKLNCDLCFTNYKSLERSQQLLSIPPSEPNHALWNQAPPNQFLERCSQRAFSGVYGKEVNGTAIEGFRLCWDALTPTHDFLITPHPHCKNLYLATGGSFHGWKFLPAIGEYIVRMMNGTLEADYAERWAWDKPYGFQHSANASYEVVGDLKDWTLSTSG